MGFPLNRLRSAVALATIAVAAAAHADPVLWINDNAGGLGKVDVATGAVTLVGRNNPMLTDIAFAPDGTLYGISFDTLYRVNSANGALTSIGSLGATLNSLVFSSSGALYAANDSLYTIDVGTGHASRIGGNGSYTSSGDLAFVGGSLYLSSAGSRASDDLVRIDTSTGAGTRVGSIGVPFVYGLATNDGSHLYGVADTGIYAIDVATGHGTLTSNYSGHGLYGANGTTFISEAQPPVSPVPEPETWALMLAGVGALAMGRMRASRRGDA